MLYGGTAIALRLAHRESVDFDFFSSSSFVPEILSRAIPFLAGAEVMQSSKDTFVASVSTMHRQRPVKVSFFGGLRLRVIDTPDTVASNGLRVASLRDIAGTKAKVLHDRIELKDYLDVAALIDTGMTLADIVSCGQAVFDDRLSFVATMSAITSFDDPPARSFPLALRRRLERAARGVRPLTPPPVRFQTIVASVGAK